MEKIRLVWQKFLNWVFIEQSDEQSFLKRMYGPAIRVGNFDRVRKKGEKDGDEVQLSDLNKEWSRMLREDPWRIKLMVHVRHLHIVSAVLIVFFVVAVRNLSPHHILFDLMILPILLIGYSWFWIGRWHQRVEKKVFDEFKKKHGKHFHLR